MYIFDDPLYDDNFKKAFAHIWEWKGGGLEGDGLDNFCYQKINISPVSFSLFLHSVLIKLNLEKTVNIIFNDVNIPHAVLKQ